VLAQWRNSAAQALDDLTRKRQTILTMSREIFETLRPRGVRWLAGTDSGAYDLMVPGPALIDELETMERLGLPAVDVLSAATTNAADAMRWSTRIGRIATGMQADLLILRDNPLETVHNLRSVESVSVRGMWLEDAQALRRAPAEVWSKSATPGEKPDRAAVQAHLDALRALYDRGYAFNHFHLAELKQLITGFGYQDLAADVDLLHYAAK
jgi:hypothetical protein